MRNIGLDGIIHTMTNKNKPIAYIDENEKIKIETISPGFNEEKFEEINKTKKFPKRVLSITGPIYINGCKKNDILKITVEDIILKEQGKMWAGQWIGLLQNEIQDCFIKTVKIEDNKVHFNEDIIVDTKAMIGTLGLAPKEGEEIDCLIPNKHGGNMDVKEIGIGSSVYLKAEVDGGLLSLGDVHSLMGKGELLGTGIETGSYVILYIQNMKKQPWEYPIIENEDSYIIAVSGRNFKNTIKKACNAGINLIMRINNYSYNESYAFIGQLCDLEIAQVVNPLLTFTLKIPKKFLKGKIY